MFTSSNVNTETFLHFFHKITNERGKRTVFTFFLWPIRVRILFELFHKIISIVSTGQIGRLDLVHWMGNYHASEDNYMSLN